MHGQQSVAQVRRDTLAVAVGGEGDDALEGAVVDLQPLGVGVGELRRPARAGDPQAVNVWAGTGYRQAEAAPVAAIIEKLMGADGRGSGVD